MNEMNDVLIPQRAQNPNLSNVSEPVSAERSWSPFNSEMQQSTDRWMEMARTQAQQTPSAYMQLKEVRDREDVDRLNNARRSRDLLESAIANTDYGSQMTPRMVDWLNAQRGIVDDGKGIKDGQIMNGGYNPKTGGFGFTVATVGSDGAVSYRPREMPRTEIYGLMAIRPEMFRMSDVDNVRNDILKSGPYTEHDLGVFANRYADSKKRLEEQYLEAQYRWDYRRGRGGLFGSGLDGRYGKKSSSTDVGKFSNDQVQYFINKRQQLMDERSKLDPRKAENQKRIAEIDEEMLDAKACERIAARQGIIFNGQNIVLPQQTAKPASDTALGIIGKHTENPDPKNQKRGYPDEQKAEVKSEVKDEGSKGELYVEDDTGLKTDDVSKKEVVDSHNANESEKKKKKVSDLMMRPDIQEAIKKGEISEDDVAKYVDSIHTESDVKHIDKSNPAKYSLNKNVVNSANVKLSPLALIKMMKKDNDLNGLSNGSITIDTSKLGGKRR